MRPLRRILVALVTLVVATFVADWSVRAVDLFGISYYGDVQTYLREAVAQAPPEELTPKGRIFQNRPDVDLDLRSFDYRTGPHSFRRGAEPSGYAPDEQGLLRILFLGDSVTLAWGVDDEDSWIRRVEREGSAPDGRPLRCLNAGHLLYETTQQASLLEHLGPTHRPDVVALTFIANDLQPTYPQVVALATASTAESAGGLGSAGGLFARVFPGLRALGQYLGDVRGVRDPDGHPSDPMAFYPSGWPACELALERVRAASSTLGARLVILDHTAGEIPELAAWCERAGVDRVNTYYTDDELALDIRNSRVDLHANELGNELIADKTLAGLRALGVLAD